MKKTKINFEDIQAGDLIEVVGSYQGVKSVQTGIAFESDKVDGETIWMTAQGGAVAMEWDRDDIYRIDVREVQFDDIKKGDNIKVTTRTGNITTIIEDMAVVLVDASINPYWVGAGANFIVYKYPGDAEQTIEILEAGE